MPYKYSLYYILMLEFPVFVPDFTIQTYNLLFPMKATPSWWWYKCHNLIAVSSRISSHYLMNQCHFLTCLACCITQHPVINAITMSCICTILIMNFRMTIFLSPYICEMNGREGSGHRWYALCDFISMERH